MGSQDAAANTPKLRYAIIGGAAGIALTHLRALAQLDDAELVGMSDINEAGVKERAAEYNCAAFVDHREMLQELRPDVAVITTPHPFHPPIAIDCFELGAHVLVEKPIAVEVAEADAMIAAADKAGKLLAVNFQQRFRPDIEFARQLIASGELGEIVRVLCVEPWYRPAAYYRSASWRGTWKGEGGGILMNQAPHTLDLLCHLAGLPAKVWGWTRTLKHAIEVEDTAQAMFEYSNGAPGYFTSSTVEAGRKRRIQIVGDRGSIDLEGSQVTIQRFNPPMSEHRATATEMFSSPQITTETVDLPSSDGGGHLAVYRDLQRAIREGGQPRADGREGLMSLELANAITLSSYSDNAVTLPLDRGAYSALLADLRAGKYS